MPTSKKSPRRPAKAARPAARPKPKAKARPAKPAARKPAPATQGTKPAGKSASKPAPAKPSVKKGAPLVPQAPPPVEASQPLPVPLGLNPTRVLALQFVRDGDEFLARLETAAGQITELKNRSLDQLLTMVAGELEDLLG